MALIDHCRIGSLEICPTLPTAKGEDHCRIGSLEITQVNLVDVDFMITAA